LRPASLWLSRSSLGIAHFPHDERLEHSRPRGRVHCNDLAGRAPLLLRHEPTFGCSRRDPCTLAGARRRPWRGRAIRQGEKTSNPGGRSPSAPTRSAPRSRCGRAGPEMARRGGHRRGRQVPACSARMTISAYSALRIRSPSRALSNAFGPGKSFPAPERRIWRRYDPPQGADSSRSLIHSCERKASAQQATAIPVPDASGRSGVERVNAPTSAALAPSRVFRATTPDVRWRSLTARLRGASTVNGRLPRTRRCTGFPTDDRVSEDPTVADATPFGIAPCGLEMLATGGRSMVASVAGCRTCPVEGRCLCPLPDRAPDRPGART